MAVELLYCRLAAAHPSIHVYSTVYADPQKVEGTATFTLNHIQSDIVRVESHCWSLLFVQEKNFPTAQLDVQQFPVSISPYVVRATERT